LLLVHNGKAGFDRGQNFLPVDDRGRMTSECATVPLDVSLAQLFTRRISEDRRH